MRLSVLVARRAFPAAAASMQIYRSPDSITISVLRSPSQLEHKSARSLATRFRFRGAHELIYRPYVQAVNGGFYSVISCFVVLGNE
jgi:hypothetical protein